MIRIIRQYLSDYWPRAGLHETRWGKALAPLWSCLHWVPLTTRGVMFIAAAWLAFRYLALQQHDRLLLAASVGGIVLLIVLAVTVLSVAIWLRFLKPHLPSSIDSMESVETSTGLVLPNVSSIPCILVDIRWMNCDRIGVRLKRGRGCLHETIRPTQRLQRSEIVRQFAVSDVFGLCRVKFRRIFPQSIRVEPYPATGCSVTLVRRDQQGDDLVHPNGKPNGDLIEMRHYRPGDPLKLVLWKHYARTRQLLVRQPENAIASMSQTIACFVAGPGDQATAGVARAIVTELKQSGQEMLFQADGATSATDCSIEAIDQIIQSADVRNEGGRIIAGMGVTLESSVIKNCIAFVPSQPGEWIDTVLAGKAASQLYIDAIIGIDETPASRKRRFLPTWAFRRASSEAIDFDQLQAVVARLSAAGISTRVIHRRSGQALSAVALKGMLS